MKYILNTIPHSEQRYPTVGDYWTDPDGTNHIVVSDMGNDDYAFLVMLHELVEQYLTKKRGINEEKITEFDKIFELNRKEGNVDEPGNDKEAPYRLEHNIATFIESGMAQALGVDWDKYDDAVNNL
jgi:hypothetical protein